jgi:hypothetical protein
MEKVTEPIRAYKGFDKDLKCRGFQYEIGKEYELKEGEHPVACERGFHACPNPNDLFAFYSPSEGNRYCEVELSGEIDDSESDKIAASRIKIIKELTIFEVANLKKDYTESHTDDKKSNTGNRSSASNTGNWSSASNTGDCSSASNTGDCSSASNTGDWSSASNTGDCSSASNTGDWSSASNTGYRSSAEVTGKDSVAAVFGYDCKARAAKGCALFLTERGEWNGETYPILNVLAVIVDGEKVKADTWYQLKDGELKECE